MRNNFKCVLGAGQKTMKGPNIKVLIKHRFLEFRPVDVSQEGEGGLRETSMGGFWLQNRFVSLP